MTSIRTLPLLLVLLLAGLVFPLTASALPEMPARQSCVLQNRDYGPSGRSIQGMDQYHVYVFFRCDDATDPIAAVRMVEGYGKTLATREIAARRRCQLTSSSMSGSLITEGPRFVGEPEPDSFTLSYQAAIECRPPRHAARYHPTKPQRVQKTIVRVKTIENVKTIDKPVAMKPEIRQTPLLEGSSTFQPATSPLPTGR